MRILIVGIGALGGLVGARLIAVGADVTLAARDAALASHLRTHGLRVRGIGGALDVDVVRALPMDAITDTRFDLIVLATKASAAIALAAHCATLLDDDGTLLPIQNGGVPQLLAEQLGADRVLGGLSNLGATLHAPGEIEQRNAGHLLIGEFGDTSAARAPRVRDALAGVEVRIAADMPGAVWAKLLINCAVTTVGAVAGGTMRDVLAHPQGRAVFDAAYDEALRVARASGVEPARMLVEAVPPPNRERWVDDVLAAYGDLRPSMLQDFERGRGTEIDFINGYVVDVGRRLGVPTPVNRRIVDRVHAIERGEQRPAIEALPALLDG